MTLSAAREAVRSAPKAYRAAFVEAPGWPLLDHPQARAALHSKVGTAYDALRERKAELVGQGYKVTAGTLGANVLRLERGSDVRVIGIDKPKRTVKPAVQGARTVRQGPAGLTGGLGRTASQEAPHTKRG